MIKKLKIRNFQSHKETDLEFNSGINALVGSSSVGKTAIIRAINWVVNNRPRGFSFHSTFSDDNYTYVEIDFDDCKVGLKKTEKESVYGLKVKKDWVKFTSFGADVPEEVRIAVNLNEINISNQFDTPFLALESAGEAGRVFGRIMKLDKVDSYIKTLTSAINTVSKEEKIFMDEMEKKKKELEKYSFIDEYEKEVENLKVIYDEFKSVMDTEESITDILARIETIEVEIEKLSKIEEYEKEFFKVESLLEELKKCSEAKSLLERVIKVNKDLGWLEFLDIISSEIESLSSLSLEYSHVKEMVERYSVEIEKYKELLSVEKQASLSFSKYVDEYKKLLIKAKKCPLCYGDLSEDKVNEIINDLVGGVYEV